MTDRPHVVLIGEGFGRLANARGLARAAVASTLLDNASHHCVQPLLYHVATADLADAHAAPDGCARDGKAA